MSRTARDTPIYQGLFLMALGLYASAPQAKRESEVTQAPAVEAPQERTQESPLGHLFKELKGIPVFEGGVQGVTLELHEGQIVINLESDELYRKGAIEVEAVWHATLDQIGSEIYSQLDPRFELEITGFGSEAEERARWILKYFRSQFQSGSTTRVRLFALESGPGQRIRFRIIEKAH